MARKRTNEGKATKRVASKPVASKPMAPASPDAPRSPFHIAEGLLLRVLRILQERIPGALIEVGAGIEEYESGGEQAFAAWLTRPIPPGMNDALADAFRSYVLTKEQQQREQSNKKTREQVLGNILDYVRAYPSTHAYFESLRARGDQVPSEDDENDIRSLLLECNFALRRGECRSDFKEAAKLLRGERFLGDRLASLEYAFECALDFLARDKQELMSTLQETLNDDQLVTLLPLGPVELRRRLTTPATSPLHPALVISDVWYVGRDPHELGSLLSSIRTSDPAFMAAEPKRLRADVMRQLREAQPADRVRKGGSGNKGAIHSLAQLAVHYRAFGYGAEPGESFDAAVARAKTAIHRLVKRKKHGQGV